MMLRLPRMSGPQATSWRERGLLPRMHSSVSRMGEVSREEMQSRRIELKGCGVTALSARWPEFTLRKCCINDVPVPETNADVDSLSVLQRARG
jgi:hypothetical protein